MQDDPQMTADPQVESEIVPRIAGLEWVEKSDAVDVLATRQTRTAMTQEKLTRGPRQTGAVNHWSASKQDLARLAGRTRCYSCREVGHVNQSCPEKRSSSAPVEWERQRPISHLQ